MDITQEMRFIGEWKNKATKIKVDVYAVYLACRDPRVPWYAKAFAACVVAYAFSPVDLIPDFIPILGYLDDLILIPLGITLTLKMIPETVLMECREKARSSIGRHEPKNWVAAGVIVSIWLILIIALAFRIIRVIGS